jgi:hypothetical protein
MNVASTDHRLGKLGIVAVSPFPLISRWGILFRRRTFLACRYALLRGITPLHNTALPGPIDYASTHDVIGLPSHQFYLAAFAIEGEIAGIMGVETIRTVFMLVGVRFCYGQH